MKKSTWIWIGILVVFISGGLLYRHFAQEVDSRGATRLMRALEENDIDKMRKLLENSPDVHARDKSGQTALFYAAHYAQDPIVLHKLIAAGADTLATDKHGYTPLMVAAQYNPSPRIVLTLARYGRFLAPQTNNKNKALAIAAQHNNAAVIKTLLTTGADPVTESGTNAAELLAVNPHLSEQEKTDWRHIMLVLEILEAREKFQRENYPKHSGKSQNTPVKKQTVPAETSKQKPTATPLPDPLPVSPEAPVFITQPQDLAPTSLQKNEEIAPLEK